MTPKSPTNAPTSEDELALRIEAQLFAAGKPLTVHDLVENLKVGDHRPVQKALKKLQHLYAARQTSLEVHRAGEGFALQVRPHFLPTAQSVAAPDITPRSLKALALIAYHQPIRQSVLARMMGEVAYEEVARLRELGFIRAAPRGATLELSTTSKFPEYFGLEASQRGKIRELLEKRLGVTPSGAGPSGETPGDAGVTPDTSVVEPPASPTNGST